MEEKKITILLTVFNRVEFTKKWLHFANEIKVKFKKYQEQMEEIYIVVDRCITMIARLKSKKDAINLIKQNLLNKN